MSSFFLPSSSFVSSQHVSLFMFCRNKNIKGEIRRKMNLGDNNVYRVDRSLGFVFMLIKCDQFQRKPLISL